MQKNDATHFPSCCELIGEGTKIDFCAFSAKIGEITDEFNRRFADFDLLKTKLELFNNSMEVDIESQASCFQLKLCELQADPFLLSKNNERHDVFWKLVSKEQFPCLRNFALKMCSMFVSTYICEIIFSCMKRLKSDERNRMSDETLDARLRLSTSEIEANIDTIVKSKALNNE